MSDITKKYVDYAGLQEYDSQIKGVISTDFVGATSSTDGAAGRVPAPETGDENKYLRGDGTWSVGASVTVDDKLDDTSENPVQNKVITVEVNAKPTCVNTSGTKVNGQKIMELTKA